MVHDHGAQVGGDQGVHPAAGAGQEHAGLDNGGPQGAGQHPAQVDSRHPPGPGDNMSVDVSRCHPVLPVHHLQGDPQHQLDQDVEGHVEEAGVDEAVADIAPGLDPSKANFISVKNK